MVLLQCCERKTALKQIVNHACCYHDTTNNCAQLVLSQHTTKHSKNPKTPWGQVLVLPAQQLFNPALPTERQVNTEPAAHIITHHAPLFWWKKPTPKSTTFCRIGTCCLTTAVNCPKFAQACAQHTRHMARTAQGTTAQRATCVRHMLAVLASTPTHIIWTPVGCNKTTWGRVCTPTAAAHER